jgi:hypothetical protein
MRPALREALPAAHELYRQLSEELGDRAHPRYNASLSRITSSPGQRNVREAADAAQIRRLAPELDGAVPSGTRMYLIATPRPSSKVGEIRRSTSTFVSSPTPTWP